MAVRVKITPLQKTIKLIVDSRLSPLARSQRVAAFARQEIDAIDKANASTFGTIPPKTVTVDGREGALLESVNPDHGIIIAEWRLVSDVLAWIMQTLRARSPVDSGRYRDSHTLYADGTETDANAPVPPASEYIFLNTTPYARKIEFGKTKSGRDFVIQVDNHIYERTAADAVARFGNLAKIRFSYQSLGDVGATSIGKWAGSSSARALAHRHGHRSNSTEWLTRVPAIVVTLR